MIARLGVVTLALLASACVTEHPVAVEIVPPRGPDGGPEVPAAVTAWELSLVRLSNIETCPTAEEAASAEPIGMVGHAQSFAAADGMGLPIGEVPTGRWALVAIGRDASCAPLLYGCRMVNVGSALPARIAVEVEPVTTSATCGSCRSCTGAGSCDPLDERC